MSNTNNNMQSQTSNTLHNAIMEAGSKDRPPMLAPGNYVQWKSIIKRYIDTKPNHELIYYCLENPPYKLDWQDIQVPVSEGSPITTTERIRETYKNVSRANQDNSPRINKSVGYENQRIGNVDGARENVGSSVVQKSRIQCYICMEFGHVARECQKPKRAKDAAYHREKMLLCKQEEAGIQLNAEQADWRDDTDDDELEDQELEAHYMYMAELQQVSSDATDSGPIFDDEPLQKVSTNDHYNVFAMESTHPEQSKYMHDTYPIEQDVQNVIIDSLDMSDDREEINQYDDDNDLAKEHELLPSLIEKLKCEIDESKNQLARRNSTEYATQMELECAKVRGDLLSYKIDYQKSCTKYTETINALNQTILEMKNKLSTHQETISILSKQKEAQIKLYKTQEDKELDKVNELENKVKVLDNLIYKTGQSVQTMNMLNNKCRTSFAKPEFLKKAQRENNRLYDIERSRLSHINVNNGKSKESFHKQTTLLEKRMDESIPLDKQCQSSLEIFKVKSYVKTIIYGAELCKQKIANRTYIGYIDPLIQKVILTTSISRPQLKSNPQGDRVMHNNSQGKKQVVEDHRRSVKLSKNKTSVTACNDNLNAKTLNVKFVSAMCDKCVLIDKHNMCVHKSFAKPLKETVASESNKNPRNFTRKLYERVSKTCSWWYPKFTPSGYKWKPKSEKENVNPNVSMPLGNASRTANVMDTMTSRRSTVSNTPLSSNSFAARKDCPIHGRLWVLKAHDGKSQASN
nr:hypothetical protein [Tanacetum cinerariifolium]